MKKPARNRPDPVQVETLKLLRLLAAPIFMENAKGKLVPLPIAGGVVHHGDYERAYYGGASVPLTREEWRLLTGDPWDDGRPMTISDLYA
jgi:hypothetical protein